MDSTLLIRLIQAFRHCTVAVIGDLVADEFIYGRVSRVSREAPVLILEYDTTEVVPGGAGNAANNVATLGGRVDLVGRVGRDDPGRRVLAALHRRVDRRRVQRPGGGITPVKTRVLAGGVHSAKQQVVRIDRGVATRPRVARRTVPHAAAFTRAALAAVRRADAVLLSDYGSGLVTPALASRLRAEARRLSRPVPMLVDSRYDLLRYRGVTACTPNESEVEAALGIRFDDNARVLERAGRDLLEQLRVQAVLITRGSRGMALFQRRRVTVHIPIFGSDEIADVTGLVTP